MDHKRREFLRLSGNLAAAIAIAPIACKLGSQKEKTAEGENKDTTVEFEITCLPGEQ